MVIFQLQEIYETAEFGFFPLVAQVQMVSTLDIERGMRDYGHFIQLTVSSNLWHRAYMNWSSSGVQGTYSCNLSKKDVLGVAKIGQELPFKLFEHLEDEID